MKKLIIILLLIPICLNAQTKSTDIFGKEIQDDKINHFAISYIGSAGITTLSYKLLCKKTNLHPILCKAIAGISGFGIMTGLGFIKEKNDPFFNPYDMEANKLGALSGSFTIEIFLFKSITKKQLYKRNKNKL